MFILGAMLVSGRVGGSYILQLEDGYFIGGKRLKFPEEQYQLLIRFMSSYLSHEQVIPIYCDVARVAVPTMNCFELRHGHLQ